VPNHNRNTGLIQAGLNLIQQALSIYGGDLKLVVCNSRFIEMFGLPDHLTKPGASFEDTIRFLTVRGEYGDVGDQDTFVRMKVDQALAFEPHYLERTRSNGSVISIEGSPLQQGGWVTVYTDISGIKRQESLLRGHSAQLSDQLLNHSEELAKSNRQLASAVSTLEETKRQLIESEALSRTTAGMIPAHIAHIDLAERYTYSNGKLGLIIPEGRADIEGMKALDVLGNEVYGAIKPYIDKAFAGHTSVFEFSHSSDSRRVRCAFTPGHDPADSINGVYFLTMDITEEAQSRAALMQTHKRELAAQLTSGLAHDFANLLTIILGLQGRLEKIQALPDDARDMIATTRAAALRGGALLDRLANVSGPRNLTPMSTGLDELFKDIAALAAPTLPDGITLTLECSEINQPLMLDAGFLQDSILNLILNARDALGKQQGTITLTARPLRETWLEITANDSGPGFSKSALKRALEPFYTTKRNDDGSGLGLSMVYDFVQISGGVLKLENARNGGAQVTMRLPLKYASPATGSKLVILVEDSPEIRLNIREMLRDMGHKVIEAAELDEAVALADIPGVDVILSDINLSSEKTGLDLVRVLRGQRNPAALFLMTSLPPHNETRAAAAREFPLIGKPFSSSQLRRFLDAGCVA